jgi:hypothetical protein
MASVLVSDAIQLNVVGTYFGETVETTLYFGADGGYLPEDFFNLGNAMATWVGETWAGQFSHDYTPTHVHLIELGTRTGHVYDVPVTVTAEQDDHAGLPGNVSLSIKRSTGYAGRSNRGRIYLVGLAENDVVGNMVDVGFADAKVDQLNGLDAYLAGLAIPLVQIVVSRINVGGLEPHGTWKLLLEWSVVDYRADSQRRRLAGRG